MQTNLSPEFQNTPEGAEGEAILRKCVHCGFCNATCPTYQLLGDELDGPRGRIYLIKQVLEGAPVTASTQQHLDRCLTCRSCETTCPSGVEFGHLIDIGRELVDARVARPVGERSVRWLLKEGMTSPLFAPAMALARRVRPLLPAVLRDKVPDVATGAAAATAAATFSGGAAGGDLPMREPVRRILLLVGCVQPALLPNINQATLRVLAAGGLQVQIAAGAGCCGAIRYHLSDRDGALSDMRRNIDAWWPRVAAGEVDAIVSNASGCSVMLKDYAHALRGDPGYAEKAQRISALARDVSELLPELVPTLTECLRGVPSGLPSGLPSGALVFHAPCTLQHGQKLCGGVEQHLTALGFHVQAPPGESHLCCGSAGTYSLLQPELAKQLRDRKLKNLEHGGAACIVSANIGCIQHLQSGTATPVRHWIEVVDAALATARSS
jgi:glycolate oxidase iron-sulfur subunit